MPQEMSFDPSQFRIGLAICTMDHIKVPTVKSLIEVIQSGHLKNYCIVEGTLLPHARNAVTEQLLKEDITHILYLDADQCNFTRHDIELMMYHNKDILAGITPLRRKNKDGKRKLTFKPLDPNIDTVNGLLEVAHTGFFFTMVKREVLEATLQPGGWFFLDRCPREDFDPEKFVKGAAVEYSKHPDKLRQIFHSCVNYGRNAHVGQDPTGEDVNFCQYARQLGFSCWIDSRIQIGHVIEDIYTPQKLIEDTQGASRN